MPSAEYLTAYASIATFLVIAATAIAAFIHEELPARLREPTSSSRPDRM